MSEKDESEKDVSEKEASEKEKEESEEEEAKETGPKGEFEFELGVLKGEKIPRSKCAFNAFIEH